MAKEDTNEYLQQLEEEYTRVKGERDAMAQNVQGQMSIFNGENEDNLIRWQLDLKEDLDRIYHLLRGDRIVEDKEGNVFYKEAEQDALKPFNEFGVQIIMNIMSFYLNRNTILSNYDEPTINWKVFDFGNELADLLFNRYEEMGMDTPDKIKMYPMIIKELVDTVHSAYLRAYHGGERESLRTARTVTQTEQPSRNPMMQQMNQGKSKHWYNPTSWGQH